MPDGAIKGEAKYLLLCIRQIILPGPFRSAGACFQGARCPGTPSDATRISNVLAEKSDICFISCVRWGGWGGGSEGWRASGTKLQLRLKTIRLQRADTRRPNRLVIRRAGDKRGPCDFFREKKKTLIASLEGNRKSTPDSIPGCFVINAGL